MSMFTNYDNMPASYIADNISPAAPVEICYAPVTPYLAYNANGEVIGYRWSYGDTVNLSFDISGPIIYDAFGYHPYNEPIATYMSTGNQYFVFRIYNNNYDVIYETRPDFRCKQDGTVEVNAPIFSDLSAKLVKGQYELSLAIEGVMDNPLYAQDPSSSKTVKIRQTILKPEDCKVYIL